MSDNTESETDWHVDVELEGLKAFILFTCPKCGKRNRVAARDAPLGSTYECSCGQASLQFSGDSFPEVQQALDSVGKAFKDLQKTLKKMR